MQKLKGQGPLRRIAALGGGLALSASLLLTGTTPALAATDGTELVGFGSNRYAEFGNGTLTGLDAPTTLNFAGTPLEGQELDDIHITAQGTALALTASGQVYAWGANYQGEAGVSAAETRILTPTRVDFTGTALAGQRITQISTSSNGSFAVAANGRIAGWGGNVWGELGPLHDEDSSATPVDIPVAGTLLEGKIPAKVFGLRGATLVRTTTGELYGWGATAVVDPASTGTTPLTPNPVAVDFAGTDLAGLGLTDIINAHAERNTDLDPARPGSAYIALTEDGSLFSWGYGTQGALGQGQSDQSIALPTRIPGVASIPFRELVHADFAVSGAITTNGDLYTWGVNLRGNTGTGGIAAVTSPTRVTLPAAVVSVSTTSSHMVALLENNELWSWGSRSAGQTGTGVSTTDQLLPAIINTVGTPLEGETIHSLLGGYTSTVVRLVVPPAPITPVAITGPTAGETVVPGSAVTGTGEPGSSVALTDAEGTELGTAVVSAEGTWSISLPADLADGPLELTATQDVDASTARTSLIIAAAVGPIDPVDPVDPAQPQIPGENNGPTGSGTQHGSELGQTGATFWPVLGGAVALLLGGAVILTRRNRVA